MEDRNVVATESCRANRLRRAAKREGNIFRKLRCPMVERGKEVRFELLDRYSNSVVERFETLEDAEVYFADK
jgi:hypothetical protein